MSGDGFPRLVETLLSFGHDPRRVSFVEERFAPFDELIVDLANDYGAQRVVAPVRKSEPSAQGGFIAIHDGTDPCPQVGMREHGLKPSRHTFNRGPRRIGQLTVEGFDGGRPQSLGETGAQNLAVCDGAGADRHARVLRQRAEDRIELFGADAPRPQVMTIDLAGKIAAAAHELLASADRLLERKIFEAVKRVWVDESP